MNELLPFLGLGLLLFAILALWARGGLQAPGDPAKPSEIRPSASDISTPLDRDTGKRIFARQDWEFVARETPLEIHRMFHRERKVLALSWLRRTRMRTSQVMRAHVAFARQSEDLQVAMEIQLALSYTSFLILSDFLIGWIWLLGPSQTRKIVGQSLQWVAQQRTTLGQLMAVVDPANCRALEKASNPKAANN